MGGSARTVLDQAPLQQNRNLQARKRVSFPGNVMSTLVVLQTPFMHHKFTARVVLLGWHDGWSVAKTKLNSFCICAWRGSPATGLHTTLKNAWITFSAKRILWKQLNTIMLPSCSFKSPFSEVGQLTNFLRHSWNSNREKMPPRVRQQQESQYIPARDTSSEVCSQ